MDFVRHCQGRYFDLGIEPTEEAHSPLPKCLGGTNTVLLTRQDHAKHDVLQTECYGEGTLTPFYYKELEGTPWETRAREALSLNQSRGGKTQGKRNADSGHLDSVRTFDICSKGGKKAFEQGLGVFAPENLGKGGKKGSKTTNSQRWMCTISKRISAPGPLTNIQKSLGIDPSNRVRIS